MTASPFYRHKGGGVHVREKGEVVIFSPNRRGAVVEHYRKYTVGYGPGVAVVLGIVLGLVEISTASL